MIHGTVDDLRPDHHFIRPGGQVKLRPTALIQFQRRGNVQVGNRDFSCPRTGAPIIRPRVNGSAHDHISLNFLLAPVAKHEYGGRKLRRRRHGSTSFRRAGSWIGLLSRIGRHRLSASRRLTVVPKPYPLITLALQHQRLDRLGRAGCLGRRLRDFDDLGPRWRLRHRRLVVVAVIRIEVRIVRKCPTPVKTTPAESAETGPWASYERAGRSRSRGRQMRPSRSE
jgi:hypothetical protein